jgi:diguanylate cyclase (GGDEF)-like protein
MSDTRQLAVAMGEAIKLSVSNLRLRETLREHATQDAVTGLHNRRYLDENLERELHRAKRFESPLCVTMLDIDHFKQFNDRFGHQAGDVVLNSLGQLLRDNVRKSDLACRYGGEEFVLVFPDSALADTCRRVEQIRQSVKRLELQNGDQVLNGITMSAGIAQARGDGGTPSELLRAADEALYEAKRAGRDRVIDHPAA